jgi:hypothetical protein
MRRAPWTGRAAGMVLALCLARPIGLAQPVGLPSADLKPNPKWSAADVVGIVLNALQHNDAPSADHGIATAYLFASPENHRMTGPLDRFILLVKNPVYRSMLGFRSMRREAPIIDGRLARQRVTLIGASGERADYIFMLSKQSAGNYKGCWMTDGVLRVAPASPPAGETET